MLSPSLPKTNYEVYINVLPFQSRNLNNLSKTARLKMFCLDLLTFRTLGHIICNVLLHAIPPIDLFKIMIHLGGTWMYGVYGTMGLCNDPCPQFIRIWYTEPVLVPKYPLVSQSKRLIHINQHLVLQLHQHRIKMLTLIDFNY